MTIFALVLVLLSAMAHATWNLLAKRAINQEVFIWWLLIAISVLLLPLAVVLIWQNPIVYPGWWFVLGTVVLHAFYFVFLGRSYTYADFSLVYPIARGVGPSLVPVIGVVVLKETVTPLAIAGIVTVVLGIYTVYWWGRLPQVLRDPFKLFREAGARYALLTGLVIAVYSVWDKMGVRYVNPFLYMYFLALGSALFLAPYVLRVYNVRIIRIEIQRKAGSIVIAGLLMFLAYGLILLALQFSRVSYISPSREVGIVMGVVLGIIILKEPFGKGRVLGSCLIVLGLVLIAIAP
jgi:drug/metabolite transporter (DMT)-like permease